MELTENPHAIYLTDVVGRTALSWAASRGQEYEIGLLISYGADANSMDTTGKFVIHRAVDSDRTAAVRLVLQAGATPDPIIPRGLKRNLPILGTIMNCEDTTMLKTILDSGPKVDVCGPEGTTALHLVSQHKTPEYIKLRLEHNASVNAKECRWPNLLKTIAEYGDLETIKVLITARYLRLHYAKNSVPVSLEEPKQRFNKPEGFETAFVELIEIIEAQPEEISQEVLMKGGIIPFT